ncbi:YdcF family protein, partial [Rathayibacter iranicus]
PRRLRTRRPLMPALWSALFALFFLALFVHGRWREPRMLRNGVFLVAAILFAVFTPLLLLIEAVPVVAEYLALAALVLVPLAILALGGALLVNGVQMMRREGRSLGNLLSLFVGILVLVLPTVVLVLYLGVGIGDRRSAGGPLNQYGAVPAELIVLITAYFAAAFLAFALYSVVYARIRLALVPEVIVILGSGLIDGEVPPLLRSRLDRGLAVYRAEREAGRSPLLIPSGGKGSDESRAEGAAMAEYLLANGARPEDVHPETASRNTRENLELSRALLGTLGRHGPVLVVTSDYHVLRAATLTRRLGMPAQVIGARTSAYFVPSAFFREFAAVVVEHRWLHLIACVPVLVVFASLLVWTD